MMTTRTTMKVQQRRRRKDRQTSKTFSRPLRPRHRLVDLIRYFRLGDTNIVRAASSFRTSQVGERDRSSAVSMFSCRLY